jgi:hypothetical protein
MSGVRSAAAPFVPPFAGRAHAERAGYSLHNFLPMRTRSAAMMAWGNEGHVRVCTDAGSFEVDCGGTGGALTRDQVTLLLKSRRTTYRARASVLTRTGWHQLQRVVCPSSHPTLDMWLAPARVRGRRAVAVRALSARAGGMRLKIGYA